MVNAEAYRGGFTKIASLRELAAESHVLSSHA
jgi:hypothetical protein